MQAILLNKTDVENMVELDSLPPLKVQIIGDDGNPYDLTNKTLYLALSEKLATGNVLKFKKAFTVTAAVSGLAQYNWVHTQLVKDLDKAGKFLFDIILEEAATPAAVATIIAAGGNTSAPTGVSGGTYSGTSDTTYLLEVTTGGTYGIAVITVTSTGAEAVNTTYQPASGVAAAIGTLGASATFSGAGAFVSGDKWTIAAAAMIPGGRRTINKESTILTVRATLSTT